MKILVATNWKTRMPQFIVDAGNRYTFMFKKNMDGTWERTGGHLWQSGQPRVPATRELYWNPNTGETKGLWKEVLMNS